MLRRSIFELSRRGCIRPIPRQIPAYLSSRKEFSSASLQNASQGPGSKGNLLEENNKLSKLDVASIIIGGSILTAYQLGYFDQLLGKEQDSGLKSTKIHINNYWDLKYLGEPVVLPNGDEHNRLITDVPLDEQRSSTRADVMHMAELNKERAKAAAAIKPLQEKAEDKLKMELERKENEAELELKKIQELAKAELAAAIASEKTSQIESTSDRDE